MASISLTKALKLRKAIEAVVNKPVLKTSAKISVLVAGSADAPQAAVDRETAVLAAETSALDRLVDVLAKLRIATARANVEYGIESLLAHRAAIDRKLGLVGQLAGADPTPSEEEMRALVKLALKDLDNPQSFHRETTITFSAVTAEAKAAAESRRAALLRDREGFDEARVAANAEAKIEIADDDAVFLRERGLI
jgi:hypothetical protein